MTRERDVARGALAGPGNIMGTPQQAIHEAVHDLTAQDRRLAAQSALRVRPAKESVELAADLGHFDGNGAVRTRRGERSVARAGGPEPKQELSHGDSIVVLAIGGVDREIIEQLKNGVSRAFKKRVTIGRQNRSFRRAPGPVE